MSSTLNEPRLDYKSFPEEGTGRVIDEMPKLIREGRVPLLTNQLMEKRLEVADSKNQALRDSWLLNWFFTGDSVLSHPDGRVKVVLNYQLMRELNPNSKLKEGFLVLLEGAYESADGPEFKREELAKYGLGEWLNEKDINNHPILKTLARDPVLLKNYAGMILRKGKEFYGYKEAMGVFLEKPKDVPVGGLWCVVRLVSRSYVDGSCRLVDDLGRLVGVAPEAQSSVAQENLEDRVEVLQQDRLIRFRGKIYVAED